MHLAIITDEYRKAELQQKALQPDCHITWLTEPQPVPGADAVLDFLFTEKEERIENLKQFSTALICVSAPASANASLPAGWIRFNGWPGFVSGESWEAAAGSSLEDKAMMVAAALGRQFCWVPDQPGLVSARILCTIIQEAWLALEEKVSSREEIDIAMKAGTGYPRGPFEWCTLIGAKEIITVLNKLTQINKCYQPAFLLLEEAKIA